MKSAARRQKKKSRRTADIFSRTYALPAALILKAAVSLRLHKPMTTDRNTAVS